ncbi:MAG: MFS transporter [bacterium (Candidatus Stahlbacteria) CG08_land_8_20_14_0_20_40_26]|nr:MAG: MFS transporter [bacterium (Candidatus Stahlbacteria) CG08_land_8_20_14_0_20_40_26]
MTFAVKDTLTEEEIQSGLGSIIREGLATQMMVTLTGGVFLVAFALKLGASNLVIGLLAAIPPLAQLIQIPSIYLVEKYRVRRTITVYAAALSRIFWLPIAVIPLLFSIQAGLTFLIIALALNAAFAGVGGCSWNSWMRDLIPQDRLGAFFSKRMSLSAGLGILLSLAAGFYIDYWRKLFPDYELYGYSILFFLGFLAGMLGVYFISTIPEHRMAYIQKNPNFLKLILQPFRDANFKNLLMFLGSWNFAVNLAAPFFTVYMLKRLQLDMSFIIGFTVLSQLTNLAFLRIWGRFSDRFSNKSVLGVNGPLFMMCILAWTFTTLPGKYILTIPLLVVIHIFMGISTAGVTLASGNIGLKLAPKGQATAYLATNSLVNSLAAGIAPVLGGKFADFFAGRELSWVLKWTSPGGGLTFQTLNLQQWDFFFVFAFLIGLYSIHRLAMVKEVGEVKEKIVLQELVSEIRKEMRNLSTAGGLRQVIQFPFYIVKTTFKRRR